MGIRKIIGLSAALGIFTALFLIAVFSTPAVAFDSGDQLAIQLAASHGGTGSGGTMGHNPPSGGINNPPVVPFAKKLRPKCYNVCTRGAGGCHDAFCENFCAYSCTY